jgi:phosphate transport system permease protein
MNYLFVSLTSLATAVAVGALILILISLVMNGLGGFDWHVLTLDQPPPGEVGGLRNALVGSLIMCGAAMVIAVVLGILAGTWLAEYGDGNRLAATVRFLNDVLLSAPSILIGLFVYELLVKPFHGFSALAGAVALAFLATPVVTRTTEDILRLQSNALREAGMALGANRGLVIRAIIWRASASGLMTGALLGFARISGETAPLLFTSLGNPFLSFSLTQPMSALPTTIFQFALSAYDDWRRLAWVGALIIAVAVLTANIIGRALARGSAPK